MPVGCRSARRNLAGLVNAGEYQTARERMTREAVAAAEGAFEGGATEVLINDSHDTMRNLLPELLPDLPG